MIRSQIYLGLYLPQDVKQELDKLAKEDGRSLSSYVRKILADHINGKRQKQD